MSATGNLPRDRIDPRTIPEAIRQEAMLGGLFARVPEAIVLLDTDGRISGPSGAAAKLGMPRTTLESKLLRLGIDKYGQKRSASK